MTSSPNVYGAAPTDDPLSAAFVRAPIETQRQYEDAARDSLPPGTAQLHVLRAAAADFHHVPRRPLPAPRPSRPVHSTKP